MTRDEALRSIDNITSIKELASINDSFKDDDELEHACTTKGFELIHAYDEFVSVKMMELCKESERIGVPEVNILWSSIGLLFFEDADTLFGLIDVVKQYMEDSGAKDRARELKKELENKMNSNILRASASI